jgi:hypothetical protein
LLLKKAHPQHVKHERWPSQERDMRGAYSSPPAREAVLESLAHNVIARGCQ